MDDDVDMSDDSFEADEGGAEAVSRGRDVWEHLTTLSQALDDASGTALSTRFGRALAAVDNVMRIVMDGQNTEDVVGYEVPEAFAQTFETLWDRIINSMTDFEVELIGVLPSLSASIKNRVKKEGGPLKKMMIFLKVHEDAEGVHQLPKKRVQKLVGCCVDLIEERPDYPIVRKNVSQVLVQLLKHPLYSEYISVKQTTRLLTKCANLMDYAGWDQVEKDDAQVFSQLMHHYARFSPLESEHEATCLTNCRKAAHKLVKEGSKRRLTETRDFWDELLPGVNACVQVLVRVDYTEFVKLVNRLTPSLIKLWESARASNKSAVLQGSFKKIVLPELMTFFALVCLVRPESTDASVATADTLIRQCLATDRAAFDLASHVSSDLDIVQQWHAELTALDAVLRNTAAGANGGAAARAIIEDNDEDGGGGSSGKRRKVDHSYASVWDRVLHNLDGDSKEALHWVLAIPRIVNPRQDLAAFVPGWEDTARCRPEPCADILDRVGGLLAALVDARRSAVAVHCFAALNALLALQVSLGASESPWPRWDAVVDKAGLAVETSPPGSHFAHRGVEFLMQFFSSPIAGSVPSAALQKLCAKPRSGDLTSHLALVGVVNTRDGFALPARTACVRSLLSYSRRDVACPSDSWTRAKLALALVQREIDVDTEAVFLRPARDGVAARACGALGESLAAAGSITDAAVVFSLEAAVAAIRDPSAQSAASSGGSQGSDSAMDGDASQGHQAAAAASRLVRGAQLLPFVLEHLIESSTQCCEDFAEAAGADAARRVTAAQTRLHQKMAFHIAVYLKVRCFLADELGGGGDHPDLTPVDALVLKLLEMVTAFVGLWTAEALGKAMKGGSGDIADFEAVVAFVETCREIFELDPADVLGSHVERGAASAVPPAVCGSTGPPPLRHAFGAFLTSEANAVLFRALDRLAKAVSGKLGLQSRVLSLAPPEKVVGKPSLRPRHLYDRSMLACVDVLHSWRAVLASTAAVPLGREHWSSAALRAFLGNDIGPDDYAPPWCVFLSACLSVAWGSSGIDREDRSLAADALKVVLAEARDNEYLEALELGAVETVLSVVTHIVAFSARSGVPDASYVGLDKLWAANKILDSASWRVRCVAAAHASAQSSARAVLHPGLRKRMASEKCAVVQVHLAEIMPTFVGSLPPGEVAAFLKEIVEHCSEQIGGAPPSSVFCPKRAVALVTLGRVALFFSSTCSDVLQAIVAHEYACHRTQRLASAVVDKLAATARFSAGAEFARNFLPVLLPVWLRSKVGSLKAKDKTSAARLLRSFPWFLFDERGSGRGDGTRDFLAGYGAVILPTLAIEAIVSSSKFLAMFESLFREGAFGDAVPKIYAQSSLAPVAPEVVQVRKVVGQLHKSDLVSCTVEVLRCVYSNVKIPDKTACRLVAMDDDDLAEGLKNICGDLGLKHDPAKELLARNAAIDVLTELAHDLELHTGRDTHGSAFRVFVWAIDSFFEIPKQISSPGGIPRFYVTLSVKVLCKTLVSTSVEATISKCVQQLGKLTREGRQSPHFLGERGAQVLGDIMRALRHVMHEHESAATLLDKIRKRYAAAFEHHVTSCMEASFADLRSIALFSRAPGKADAADKQLTSTVKQLWRFVIGIDGVEALPEPERMRELRDFVKASGEAVQQFVWHVTAVRVFRRFVELGASGTVSKGGASAAVAFLGDLGAFELTPAHLLDGASAGSPPLIRNIVVAKSSRSSKANDVGLSWCAEHLIKYAERALEDRLVAVVRAAVVTLRGLVACKGNSFVAKAVQDRGDELSPFEGKGAALEQREPAPFTQALWRDVSGGYDAWLRRIVGALLLFKDRADGVLWATRPLCDASTEFCEFVLPHALYDILSENTTDDGYAGKAFSEGLTAFFTAARDAPGSLPARCVKCVADAMNVLRTFDKGMGRPWKRVSKHEWLAVDPMLVAKAASRFSLHFTTVYYTELAWSRARYGDSRGAKGDAPNGVGWSEVPEYIEAIACTADPDSIYGTSTTVDVDSLVRTYEHEHKWSKALALYDDAVSSAAAPGTAASAAPGGAGRCEVGVCRTLFSAGFEGLRALYTASLDMSGFAGASAAEIVELQCEAAWRQAVWGPLSSLRVERTPPGDGPNAQLWRQLQRLDDRDFAACEDLVETGRLAIWEELRSVEAENATRFIPALAHAQTLREIAEAVDVASAVGVAGAAQDKAVAAVERMWALWMARTESDNISFDSRGTVLSCRAAILGVLAHQAAAAGGGGEPLLELLSQLRVACLRSLGDHARESGHDHNCTAAVRGLQSLGLTPPWDKFFHLERAKNLWFQGEERLALRLAQAVSDSPDALAVLGQWSIATRSESPSVILDRYLLPAVEKYASEERTPLRRAESEFEARIVLAHFADDQYKASDLAMLTTQRSLRVTEDELASHNAADKGKKKTLNVRKRVVQLKNRRKWEEQELERLRSERQSFLAHAARNYLQCLRSSSAHDIQIFRVCNLWFSNPTSETVREELRREPLPSHKWLPLIYQLAAKLGAGAEGEELVTVVERCVVDHPHHTLFVLIALKNGRDGAGAGATSSSALMDAVVGLLERVKRHKGMASLVGKMEDLSARYIELANLDMKKTKTDPKLLDKWANKFKLARVKNMAEVAVVTRATPVDPTGSYGDIVGIDAFDGKFELAGGVNMPRIINCRGTDGRKYKQVVKGNDDVRQDAVMQQVFELANAWLKHDRDSLRRRLHVCTYKIVPLAPQSGVLEWCTGTVPLSQYLVRGDGAAHHRLHPNKLNNQDCRKAMADVADKSIETKLAEFRKVCAGFPPVMRFFFLEHFSEPADWFEKRLAYTRSVSTGAIVGYILGLGDRHPSNILINTSTAEVVNIDLGVSFDQGKELPTPETIPFRLTRDIVDGMGVAGVDGVFRRCCEHTMRVLRQSQVSLLTILEVFLHDPLYSWKLSDAKVSHIQPGEDPDAAGGPGDTQASDVGDRRRAGAVSPFGSAGAASPAGGGGADAKRNEEAQRVLIQVRRKLDGTAGHASQLSVAGHVNALIREARDDRNLCRVFAGWHPWV